MVLWGTGTYLTQVATGSSAPDFPSFFGGVLHSSYLNTLSEYGVKGHKPNNGTFSQRTVITPSFNTATIDDADIQPELQAQINAQNLPAPDANTIYFIFFPQGKTITMGGHNSITGFCAYHGTTVISGQPHIRYAVMPNDAQDAGCGASVGFGNMTSVASHELIETMTDPEVGLAQVVGPPLTWYVPSNSVAVNGGGEIMDVCNGRQATVTGGDGRSYTVQKVFSDEAFNQSPSLTTACISSAPTRTFNVGSAAIAEGDTGTRVLRIPVTLSAPSFFNQAVNFAVTNGTAHGGTHAATGVDFITAHGTMHFNARTTSPFTTVTQQYINVTIDGDITVEPTENFTVTLTNAASSVGATGGRPTASYILGRSTTKATIFNDDPLAGNKLSIGDMSIVEGAIGNRAIAFPVTLARPSVGATTVHWKLANGTAHIGTDFTGSTTGTITLPNGATVGYVSVTIPPHASYPTTKSFTLSITSASGGGGGSIIRLTGIGTIIHS
jgi:hypothetical protein